jgi:hypothetical protein
VLSFPISQLTAAALTDAIAASLLSKYEYEAKWNVESTRHRRTGGRRIRGYVVETESELLAKRERRAEREAEGVIQDIQALLEIPDVSCGFIPLHWTRC